MKTKIDKTLLPSYWKNSHFELMDRKNEMLLFQRTLANKDVYFDLVTIDDLDGYLTCNAYCWHFEDWDEAYSQFQWHAQNDLL